MIVHRPKGPLRIEAALALGPQQVGVYGCVVANDPGTFPQSQPSVESLDTPSKGEEGFSELGEHPWASRHSRYMALFSHKVCRK